MAELNNEKVISIPGKCEELAELVGIILGDGCITAYNHPNKKNMTFSLRVTCHAVNDYTFVTKHINSLFINLFDLQPSVYKAKTKKAICLNAHSIRLVKFFNKLGLKSGNKIKNQQGIPTWIFKNKDYLRNCVRGLFDTDGCVALCGNGTLFPRIGLKSHNPKLRKDFRKALLILGFNPSKWICGNNLLLYRKSDVFKYIKEIGFSNLKHKERFKLLNKAPVV